MGRVVRALLLSPFVRQRLTGLVVTTRAEDLRELAELVRAGELVAPVGRTYQLDEAVTALQDVRAGRVAGKAVVTVAG
jgi:NADPH:quinone reductase-like Zn-dependent oxidoreductase